MNVAISDQAGQWIIKIGFSIVFAVIAWTVVASLVFLMGTGLLHDFPHPFYQWWLYALNFDGNRACCDLAENWRRSRRRFRHW